MARQPNNEIESELEFTKNRWPVLRRIGRMAKRTGLVIASLMGVYLLLAFVGLIPVNSDFVETEDGIEVFIFSGEFHSDLILPIENDLHDWRPLFKDAHFETRPEHATHMSFGWGDRGFYIDTPSWKDLRVSTAVKALLLPSETVMHVSHVSKPPPGHPDIRSVTLSAKQYQEIASFIMESFKTTDGEIEFIPDAAHHDQDAFYVATGRYHAFMTCNGWAGNAMKEAGIKVGCFTPFPKTIFLYLPD